MGPAMSRAWAGWQRWAFDPVDTASMAALRIAIGLVTLGWALSYLPSAEAFLSDDGLVPVRPDLGTWAWNVDIGLPRLALGLLCAFALMLTLGWHTRVAAVAVVILLIAIQRRDLYTLNSGDVLVRNVALFVALMPSGETWSLDARRRNRPAVPRAPWALRMLQVQVSILYAAAVMAKLRGDAWNEGTAVGIALQLGDLQRFVVPEALSQSLLFSAALTYGTLVMETVLVFALWVPRWRLPAAIAGIMMHLGIDATLAVGWFSYALIAAYLAFAPPAATRRVVGRVLGWLRARVPRAQPPATEPIASVHSDPLPPGPVSPGPVSPGPVSPEPVSLVKGQVLRSGG